MKASIKRSQELVENVMEFARAKLGNGIPVQLEAERDLEKTLTEIVEEARA